MYSRPTAVEVLRTAKANLDTTVIPDLSSEPAIVAAAMISDLLGRLMERIPVEAIWMKEEIAEQREILANLAQIAGRSNDGAAAKLAEAVAEVPEPPLDGPEAYGIEVIQREYAGVSFAMAHAVTALHALAASGDVELAEQGLGSGISLVCPR